MSANRLAEANNGLGEQHAWLAARLSAALGAASLEAPLAGTTSGALYVCGASNTRQPLAQAIAANERQLADKLAAIEPAMALIFVRSNGKQVGGVTKNSSCCFLLALISSFCDSRLIVASTRRSAPPSLANMRAIK